MLVGRDAEVAHVESVLVDVRAGHARSLLLNGEAGIGKTALLEVACDRAADFVVLRAGGVETEGEIGGAVVAELLGPPGRLRPGLAHGWTAMPKRGRRALEAAWDMRPPGGDRYSLVAAWAALLVASAESCPVLVVVDDAQWSDTASLEAVLYVARRFHDVRVGTVLAVREPPEAAVAFDRLERLHLGRLDPIAAELLARREGSGSPEILSAAAGHPLALVELARRGSASASGDVAAGLFGSRVAALSSEGRRTLLVAALAGSLDSEVAARAGSRRGVDELIRVGLASRRSGTLEPTHPLVRSLVTDLTGPAEQRAAHASLAAALSAGPQRTRHLALAADGVDADLAAEVEHLGMGMPPSVWALGRAASLTPPGGLRDRRFLAAARAAFDRRDIAAARGFLDQVSSTDPDTGLGIDELRARLALVDGARLDGARALCQVARRTAPSDRDRAVRLLVTASIELSHSTTREAQAAIDDAAEHVGSDPVLRLLVDFARAELLGASGEFVAAQRAFRDLAERGDPEIAVHADHAARLMLLEAMYAGGLRTRGRQVAIVAVHDARNCGALGDLHVALSCLFSIEREDARFDAAEDAAAEELELAGGLGRTAERREALGQLAWCDAVKGREAECRQHLDERRKLSEQMGIGASPHPALGLLLLGVGDVSGAAAAFTAAEEDAAGEGVTPAGGLRPRAADLVEALAHSGERDKALEVLEALQADAGRLERPLAWSLAHRCQALLTAGDAADALFEDSLRWEQLEPSPFERARTQLCWGEHLRRRRAKGAATTQLEAARNAFAGFGADLWVSRAERELAANGERVRPRRDGTGVDLTSQERRVVDLVSRGRTNREVAADMFLSVNTVETHLRHIFAKLGVSNRTQLAVLNHRYP